MSAYETGYAGVYVGEKAHLKGARAMVKPSKVPGWVLAKFDNATVNKGATWHPLLLREFLVVPKEGA